MFNALSPSHTWRKFCWLQGKDPRKGGKIIVTLRVLPRKTSALGGFTSQLALSSLELILRGLIGASSAALGVPRVAWREDLPRVPRAPFQSHFIDEKSHDQSA